MQYFDSLRATAAAVVAATMERVAIAVAAAELVVVADNVCVRLR